LDRYVFDDNYSDAVKRVIAATDRGGGHDWRWARMMTFIRSTQWEWLFWDSAYQMRGLP
jgi:thiaminase